MKLKIKITLVTMMFFSMSTIIYGQEDYKFDPGYRRPNENTYYYKFAELPLSNSSSGEILTVKLIGGSFFSNGKKTEEMYFANRGGFKGYFTIRHGDKWTPVRIEAYSESNGSIGVYMVMSSSWSHGKVIASISGANSQNILKNNPPRLITSPSGTKLFSSTDNDNNGLAISKNGNVGIGTINPDSKLSVNGQIHTKEVKVDLVGWSDFVFYEDYKLPTLTEVENHIKEKGHLKDIPSAKEVAKNGILLGEMDSKLLQKIEELTLYTIQQEKNLHSQKEDINNLKKENEILKSLNFKLLEIQKRLDKLEEAK